MPILVPVCGRPRSGKATLCDTLASQYDFIHHTAAKSTEDVIGAVTAEIEAHGDGIYLVSDYPASVDDIQSLTQACSEPEHQWKLAFALYLDVPHLVVADDNNSTEVDFGAIASELAARGVIVHDIQALTTPDEVLEAAVGVFVEAKLIASLSESDVSESKESGPTVVKIALTGGPCGGKTSVLKHIKRRLEAEGFYVVAVPEAARIVLGAGTSIDQLNKRELLEWETCLLQTVLDLEDSITRLGRLSSPTQPLVVLCDRGTMDVAAHLDPDLWESLLESRPEWTIESLCDERYDAVLHLESVAVRSPELFTVEGDDVRSKGFGWALELDRRCGQMWSRHPNYTLVHGGRDWDEKVKHAVESTVAATRGKGAPRLDIRVMLNAEPFGFGPTAAIAQFFPYIRPRVEHVAFAGIWHTLDIQRKFNYDTVYDLEAEGGDGATDATYEAITRLLTEGKYDVFMTACDFRAIRAAQAAGVKTVVYDPLTWFWRELPPEVTTTDLYIAQNFFSVSKCLTGVDCKQVAIVPPIVCLDKAPSVTRKNHILINLGGLRNPMLTEEETLEYAQLIVRSIYHVAEVHCDRVDVISSRAVVEVLSQQYANVRTVTPPEAQALLGECTMAVQTPGLGNIYDASALASRVFWLPGANDSQGQQLALLQNEGIAPLSASWDELTGVDPIDFFAPQEEVMQKVAGAISAALADEESFTDLLSSSFTAALAAPVPEHNPLSLILDKFGTGGAADVASSAYKKLFVHVARAKETRKLRSQSSFLDVFEQAA